MNPDDLAARQARHYRYVPANMIPMDSDPDVVPEGRCRMCQERWPCDAVVLGAAREEERQARQAAEAKAAELEQGYLAAHRAYMGAVETMTAERRQRERAEAEAGRLAELLSRIKWQLDHNVYLLETAEHGDTVTWPDLVKTLHEVVDLPIKMCEARQALAEE